MVTMTSHVEGEATRRVGVAMCLFLVRRTMILPVGVVGFVMGAMAHTGMSLVFGLIHSAAFAATVIDSAEWARGLLFGVICWLTAGIVLVFSPITAAGFLMLHLRSGGPVSILCSVWAQSERA